MPSSIQIKQAEMLEPVLAHCKPIACLRHKKEPATHLCTETKCSNNPLICGVCISEGLNRSYHYDHEKNLLPLGEAVEHLSQLIKTQSAPLARIYKSTLGRGDFTTIVSQLERGPVLVEELEERVLTIKGQVELELELLVKQFQKILLIEKQEYFKLLDSYQRTFAKNIEFLRAHSQALIQFQTSLKYYANRNSFYLKMASEMARKSDWILRTKKTLQATSKNIESASYSSELSNILNLSNKIKLDIWPTWKGEESAQKANEMRFVIKRALGQWAYIPELKVLEEELEGQTTPGTYLAGIPKNYYTHTNGK